MKYLLLIVCFNYVLISQAQDTVSPPEVPLEEESGRVVYTGVKEANGTKAELYTKMQS